MKSVWRTIAFGAILAVAATAVPSMTAMTPPLVQDHDRDDRPPRTYTNSRYYRLGYREGYRDYRRKIERKRHYHRYRTDDDRQAHDYGYREGLRGRVHRELDEDRH